MTRREVERLLESSDRCLERTEALVGCRLDEFSGRRSTERREIDRRHKVRENSDRRNR